MKKTFLSLCGLCAAAASLSAAPIFTESFSYPDGALLGQGTWTITGTSITNPLLISNGRAALTTTGQDANAAFSSLFTMADGTTLYIGLTMNVSAAQATGDYFLHITPGPAGNTTDFFQRVFVRSATGGFQLGYAEHSGGATQTYGTDILSLNTDYRVVLAYSRVAGVTNDTASLYVNPTDTSVEANNTAYVTKAWNSTFAETNVVGTINLRQGTAGNAATLAVDDLAVSQTFSDVSVIPEPQSIYLLGGIALFGWNFLRRRK